MECLCAWLPVDTLAAFPRHMTLATVTGTSAYAQEGVGHVVLTLGPLGAALCTLCSSGLRVVHMPVSAAFCRSPRPEARF